MNLQCNLKTRFAISKIRSKQVAEALNVNVQTVSNWVNGRSYPTTETLFKLAKLLDCKVDDLYTLID